MYLFCAAYCFFVQVKFYVQDIKSFFYLLQIRKSLKLWPGLLIETHKYQKKLGATWF